MLATVPWVACLAFLAVIGPAAPSLPLKHVEITDPALARLLAWGYEHAYDEPTLAAWLRTNGGSPSKMGDGVLYETKAAREIEAQVARELRRHPRQGTIGCLRLIDRL